MQPAFDRSVHGVFLARPEKQMSWIYAWRIVTVMANKNPIWDRAIGDFPGNTMGAKFRIAISPNPNLAVSVNIPLTDPWNTAVFIHLTDMLPKPICKRSGSRWSSQCSIAVIARSAAKFSWGNITKSQLKLKWATTKLTETGFRFTRHSTISYGLCC
jgi:hypothetical protein